MIKTRLMAKYRRMLARLVLVSMGCFILIWWSLCPGCLHKRCWFGKSIEGSSEIVLAKARFGPIILRKDILEYAKPMEHPNTAILELRTIWEHQETIARLIVTCFLFWMGLCYLVVLNARVDDRITCSKF